MLTGILVFAGVVLWLLGEVLDLDELVVAAALIAVFAIGLALG